MFAEDVTWWARSRGWAGRPVLCAGALCAVVLGSCSSSAPPFPVASENNVDFPSASGRVAPAGPLLLRDVTVVDGTGAPPQPGMDVLLVDGRIAAIEEDLPDHEAHELPVAGQTVVPGLIDCHVHLQSVPGAMVRGDSSAMQTRQQRLQLRAYLASGVTSVLDAAISAPVLRALREWGEAGHPSPTIHALAPYLTPTEGYFSSPEMRGDAFHDLWPPIDGADALEAHFRAAQSLDPVGAKMTVERGVLFDVYRLFTGEELEGIRRTAERFDAPLFVHSMNNEAHRRALTVEPYALVHVGMATEELDEEVASAIAESGAFVVSTVGAFQMESWAWRPRMLERPWIEMRIPRVQWETAHHPEAVERVLTMSAPFVAPSWMPTWLARAGASVVRSAEDGIQESVSSGRAAKQLVDLGVPLVMGSDAGNWPVFATYFHGVGSLLEMRLLEKAGIPRQEVLASATSRAARMLGVEQEVGTVEVGKAADLVVLPDNPLEAGMAALTEPSWVIKTGRARTPSAWLTR